MDSRRPRGREADQGVGAGVERIAPLLRMFRAAPASLDQGIDPIEHRRQEQRKAVTDVAMQRTFEQCVGEYHKLHSGAWKNAKHAAQWTNTLKTYAYPVFGKWPVAEVTDVQIIAVLLPIWTTKH